MDGKKKNSNSQAGTGMGGGEKKAEGQQLAVKSTRAGRGLSYLKNLGRRLLACRLGHARGEACFRLHFCRKSPHSSP